MSWSVDGATSNGWLLQPLHPPPGPRPMMVDVHGGPSAAVEPVFPWRGPRVDLLAAGYDLFLPDPRGSFGQGEAFAGADVRDLGPGPLRDILAGVAAVEKLAPIDDRRLGLFGYSYGGYMAMWAAIRTDRFHAIAAGAGISDWISLDGTIGVEKADLALFGASSFQALPLYLSPIAHVRSVHMPVFLFGGDHHEECPIGQSLEFWHDLQALHCSTRFVVYPGQATKCRTPTTGTTPHAARSRGSTTISPLRASGSGLGRRASSIAPSRRLRPGTVSTGTSCRHRPRSRPGCG